MCLPNSKANNERGKIVSFGLAKRWSRCSHEKLKNPESSRMAIWLVLRVLTVILVTEFPCQLLAVSSDLLRFIKTKAKHGHLRNCITGENSNAFQRTKMVEKRSLLTFPPDSLLQINMGIALAGHLEQNTATIVLAFQQNVPLPNETQPLVVSGRKFSIYNHLRHVLDNYGLNGSECLKKMICQIGETPSFGGLLEDLITFILSPSMHRVIQNGDHEEEEKNYNSLLNSERLGKSGNNCSLIYKNCVRTPLDFISTFIHV